MTCDNRVVLFHPWPTHLRPTPNQVWTPRIGSFSDFSGSPWIILRLRIRDGVWTRPYPHLPSPDIKKFTGGLLRLLGHLNPWWPHLFIPVNEERRVPISTKARRNKNYCKGRVTIEDITSLYGNNTVYYSICKGINKGTGQLEEFTLSTISGNKGRESQWCMSARPISDMFPRIVPSIQPDIYRDFRSD